VRICYISYEYPPLFGGGIGTYIYNIARVLVCRGHQVTVITCNPGNLPACEEQEGIMVFRISFGERDHILLGQAVPEAHTLVYWQQYNQRVYSLLKIIQHTIDVVEWPDYRCEGAAAMLAKQTRGEFAHIPFVVRLHTPLFVLDKYNVSKDTQPNRLTRAYEKMYLQMADFICSPTSILAKIVAKELDWPGEMAILPHPLDFESFPQEVVYTDSSSVLYVGRLERRKGVETLVRAAIPLLKKYKNINLKLIGGDTCTGPGGTSMLAYLKGLIPGSLTNRVDFAGSVPREQLLAEYARARCCVFPSLFENFPNVCLEAMASGIPVLVSDNSGMVDMVTNGSSGYVFKAGDEEDLRAKLKNMVNLPYDKLREMGEQAHVEVREKFGVDRTAGLQEQYFRKITEDLKQNEMFCSPGGTRDYMKGLVSIIVPCSRGDLLRDTLDSIQAQNYPHLEIIVVDHDSTDQTNIKTLSELDSIDSQLKVIHRSDQGRTAACNEGVKQAAGEYILILNPGDLLEKQFIAATVNILASEPEIGFVYSWVKYHSNDAAVWETPDYQRDLLLAEELCHGSSLFRHIAFDFAGSFKAGASGSPEYWSFWISLAALGWGGKCIREPLLLCRQQENNTPGGTIKHQRLPGQAIIDRHRDDYEANLHLIIKHANQVVSDAGEEHDKLTGRLIDVEQKAEQLKQQISSLEQIIDAQGLELNDLKQDRDNLQNRLAELSQDRDILQNRLLEIHSSRAWKWVTRYRNARDVLRLGK